MEQLEEIGFKLWGKMGCSKSVALLPGLKRETKSGLFRLLGKIEKWEQVPFGVCV